MFRIAAKTARILVIGGLVGSVGLPAAALVTSAPASAAPTLTGDQLNGVGSDTVFCVDNKIAWNVGGNTEVNTPPALGLNIGCETTPATFTVPADTVHGAITYNSTNPPPFGSSAGIAAFVADNGLGNIAYARSSRSRKSTDPANLEFWAYALDAVSWNHFAGHAPTNLTQAQLIGIYKCDPTSHLPQFTDWSQVGGSAGPIVRYTPQSGSGTRSFFESIILAGNSSDDPNCTVRSINVPENDATQIAEADEANAIFPYSLAVYTAQKNHAATGETDLRVGTTLGQINGVNANFKNISETAAKTNAASGGDACSGPTTGFCASRYVYHTTWQMLPAAYYADTIGFVGVNRTTGVAAAGGLCANAFSADIKLFGFKALSKATTQEGLLSAKGKSFCRLL